MLQWMTRCWQPSPLKQIDLEPSLLTANEILEGRLWECSIPVDHPAESDSVMGPGGGENSIREGASERAGPLQLGRTLPR